MIKNLPRVFVPILTLAWMALIFYLSSQEAQVSSGLSGDLIRNLAQIFVREFNHMPNTEQIQMIDGLQHIVRKCAHGFLFFILGSLTMCTMHTYKMNLKSKILITFTIVLLYAVSDEIHQIFVPGRACLFSDVVIDTIGSSLGMLAMIGVMALIRKFRTHKRITLNRKIVSGD